MNASKVGRQVGEQVGTLDQTTADVLDRTDAWHTAHNLVVGDRVRLDYDPRVVDEDGPTVNFGTVVEMWADGDFNFLPDPGTGPSDAPDDIWTVTREQQDRGDVIVTRYTPCEGTNLVLTTIADARLDWKPLSRTFCPVCGDLVARWLDGRTIRIDTHQREVSAS